MVIIRVWDLGSFFTRRMTDLSGSSLSSVNTSSLMMSSRLKMLSVYDGVSKRSHHISIFATVEPGTF